MKLIILILLLGSIFKLLIVANGNFLFNMDNGRDMVAVREMVQLKNLKLIGPRTAIEGVFNGPAWYYLLAIPYILSGGDPYASIVLEIIFWAVGGFFLLKLVCRWSKWLILPIGILWTASDYIGLTTVYAFNPNPVTLLTPLLIYLLTKYFETSKLFYISSTFLLGGLFFNFEMNFGIFIPIIIVVSTFFARRELLKSRNFWLSSLFFLICLLPQVIFEIRNNFLMTKVMIAHSINPEYQAFSIFRHLQTIYFKFSDIFGATLMNHKSFSYILLLFSIPVVTRFILKKHKDSTVIISAVCIIIPFIIYTLVSSISVNPWHLGAPMVAAIVLVAYLLKESKFLISFVLACAIIFFALTNIVGFFFTKKANDDPSLFRNEIEVIDFIFKYANGKNFKVYTFMPSTYDYPYQYLFWWYGSKTYGYIPGEYLYLPNKPSYIPGQDNFQGRKDNLSDLVFLIKEPDTNDTRWGWEGNFIEENYGKKLKTIDRQMIKKVEVEVRKEL